MATTPTSLSKMNIFAAPDEIGPPADAINSTPGPVHAPTKAVKAKRAKPAEKTVEKAPEPATAPQAPSEPAEAAVAPETKPARQPKAKEAAEPAPKPWDGPVQAQEIRQSFDLPIRIRTKLTMLKGYGLVHNHKDFVRDVLERALDAELKKLEEAGAVFYVPPGMH